MTNRLAAHLTTWRWWYAIVSMASFLVASMLVFVGAVAPPESQETVNALLTPVTFAAFAFLALAAIGLLARRFPTTQDLGLRPGLSRHDLIVIAVAFVVSHVIFWLLSLGTGEATNEARVLFEDLNLAGALLPAVATIFTSVIMAPVCEELLYRGAMLRPVHDSLARRGVSPWVAAAVGIAVSAVLFAMPHLGEESGVRQSVAYLVTGVTFGLVYVLTGSMTAAMVSHSLQSAYAFGQVLVFGRGDDAVNPVLWVLVLGCPLWVYLVARGLHSVFPQDRSAR